MNWITELKFELNCWQQKNELVVPVCETHTQLLVAKLVCEYEANKHVQWLTI